MADARDILSLTEAKGILSIASSDTSQDTQVARLITSTSRRLDLAVGPAVAFTVGNEIHQFATYRDWGTRNTIEFNYCPVTTIISVTNYLGTTPTVLTQQVPGNSPSDGFYAEQYEPDPTLYSGIITRKTGLYPYPFGDLVSVTYLAGRFTSTSTVDPKFKEAAGVMLRNSWRAYQQSTAPYGQYDVPQQTFPTFAIPNYVRELLALEWQPEVGFGAS